MMKRKLILASLLTLLSVFLCLTAFGEEAPDLTENCKFQLCATTRKSSNMTDGKYTSYWESKKIASPWISLTSETPVYGLYLCFRSMPDSYVIQVKDEGEWMTVVEGDTRFYHCYYDLDGVKQIRVLSTQDGKHVMGFNEVFVFGEGETPDWVQKWEPTHEKADVLFLVAHPDDELIFLGGAIPTYAVEKQKNVVVVYLTWSNTTRRSEALNGLWAMGVRNYPVFGGFRDCYGKTADASYQNVTGKKKTGQDKVWSWMTSLFRQYRPEVVVTQDLNGEYGHGQHKMIADAATKCYEWASDAEKYEDSAKTYGLWQVKKLYLHLYGDVADQIIFDWEQPLASMGGKTGLELASEAYALHKTQAGASIKIKGKKQVLSVEETGKSFPNTTFGLYATSVGPDVNHDDFLENIVNDMGE